MVTGGDVTRQVLQSSKSFAIGSVLTFDPMTIATPLPHIQLQQGRMLDRLTNRGQ